MAVGLLRRRDGATPPVDRSSKESRKEERVAFAFLLPWFGGLLLLIAIPLLYAIWISLTDAFYLRPGQADFIGLDNFVEIFTDDAQFRKAVEVTVRWILLTTPLFLFTGLILSLLLNQRLRGMNFFRTILYVPAVLSGVAVTVLWINLFNPDLGAINGFLRAVGVANPPQWFRSPDWAMPALAVMGLWGIGGSAVIFLAGLQNIPPHLYEAASIDGAGGWAKFRNITLPMLSPTLFFLTVNAVIDALLVFAQIWVVSGGSKNAGPDDSLLFYMYYVYLESFRDGQYGYGSALAWLLTIAGVLLVAFVFRFEKRFVYYETEGPR